MNAHERPRRRLATSPASEVQTVSGENLLHTFPVPLAVSRLDDRQLRSTDAAVPLEATPIQRLLATGGRNERTFPDRLDAIAHLPGIPVDQLRRETDTAATTSSSSSSANSTGAASSTLPQQKPAKPPSLSASKKMAMLSDIGMDRRQNLAVKVAAEIKKDNPQNARTGTAESNALAAKLYAQAVAAEKEITALVETATTAGGGKREGDSHKLKDESGLSGKIAQELAEKRTKGLVGDQLPADFDLSLLIGDALRFTIVYPFEGFTDKVLNTFELLESKGYTALKVGNTFKKANASYRGINTNWRAGMGLKWELQFHTGESFRVKEHVNHGPYEGARTLPDTDSRKGMLEEHMSAVSSSIPTPFDLHGVQMDRWNNIETRGRRGAQDSVSPPIPEGIERIKEK